MKLRATLIGMALVLAVTLLPTSVSANPILEGMIESVVQVNGACDVEIEMMSQMYEFTLTLYRSQTLDGSGNVPNAPENLVGAVSGDDAYDTYTYYDSLSGWMTNYYYQLTDISRPSGTWYYQLYCDYGVPGDEYPLWWPEDITLTDCDCDDFSLHNPVPHQSSYNNLSYYSGAAVMSMIIDSLNGGSAAPAQTSFVPQPLTTGYTAAQVEAILEVHPEIASTTGWGHVQNADQDEVLFQIAYWQNHNGIGAAVPTNGDYRHWVTIEGAESLVCPLGSDPTTYGLIGFWVDDPVDGKSYKTAATWAGDYFEPTNGSLYEAVVEPPEENGSVVIQQATSRDIVCSAKMNAKSGRPFRTLDQIYETLRGLDKDDYAAEAQRTALKVAVQCVEDLMKQFAAQGIAEYGLDNDPTFHNAYSNTSADTPTYVDRTDGQDYYLVPFVRSGVPVPIELDKASLPTEDQTKVVVRVNAVTGQFLEARYTVSGSLTVAAPGGDYYWYTGLSSTPFFPKVRPPQCDPRVCVE